MGQHYSQLTFQDRTTIYTLLKEQFAISAIAKHLNRPYCTIWREIVRNKGKRGYRPKQAHERALARQRSSWKESTVETELLQYVKRQLIEGFSPDQIAGRMRLDNAHDGPSVCAQTIYNRIWEDKKAGGTLYTLLRLKNGKKRRKKQKGKPDGRGQILGRVDISERPIEANERTELGHFEADLMSGAYHKGFLVTINDRYSGEALIGHVERKTADCVASEIIRLLSLRKSPVKTITFDNGKEFSGHSQISEALGCRCYFARPYHSQDRGSNENLNGLIRQYFPKGMDLRGVKKRTLLEVQIRLNNRPRKRYDYLTPNEVYLRYYAA